MGHQLEGEQGKAVKMQRLWLHTMNVQPCRVTCLKEQILTAFYHEELSRWLAPTIFGQLCYMELTETHTKEINTHNGLFITNGYKYFRLHFLLGKRERGKEGRKKRG